MTCKIEPATRTLQKVYKSSRKWRNDANARHAEEGSPFLVDEDTLVSASAKIGGSSSSGEARARKASFAGIFVATVMLGVLFVLSSHVVAVSFST